MSNSSIWPIDRALSSSTTPGESGTGDEGNVGTLRIFHYWSLSIRLFHVTSSKLVGGILLCRDAVGVFCSPQYNRTLVGGILTLCRDAADVFCSSTHQTTGTRGDPESNGKEGLVHIPRKLQSWSLTIRLFCVISRTVIRESYLSAEM